MTKDAWDILDDHEYDENGIAKRGRKGYRQAVPGSMGLIPLDRRRYKKEGPYWKKKEDGATRMIITIPPERKNPGKGAGIRQAEPGERKAEWARRDESQKTKRGGFRKDARRGMVRLHKDGMSKVTAVWLFKENVLPDVIKRYGRDKSAVREAWNNFTDYLMKSGDITEWQYDTWQNPIQWAR